MLKIPATIFCVFLLIYLFRVEQKETQHLSKALWIPTVWLLIVASRPVSFWFSSGYRDLSSGAVEAGSPIDRFVFGVLLVVAFWALLKRKKEGIISDNLWFIGLFLLAGLSVLWSDYPLVSFKRYIRGLGAAGAALIVVTEKDSFSAFCAVIRRTSYVLIPLSVLTVKYYREIGVGFGVWGGTIHRGVTINKNSLGRLCLLTILIFSFVLIYKQFRGKALSNRNQIVIAVMYLTMAGWLLQKANSMTSLATCLVGVILLLVFRYLGPSRPWIHFLFIGLIPAFVVLILTLEALPQVTAMIGRDPTMTDRTEVWSDLLKIRGNFFLGTGYGGFWIGERLSYMWSKWSWLPNSAHNGYLEIFLQLGIAGLGLLIGCIVSAYIKISVLLKADFYKGLFFMVWLLIFVFYNGR